MRAGTAAELATEVDRIALCVHQPTSRRSDLRAALAPLGLPRPSIVAVAARFLAAGRVSFADLASMSRYDPEADVRAVIAAHVQRALLVADGSDGFTASEPFQSAGSLVLQCQCEEAERLWCSSSSLPRLADLARAHVAAALAGDLPLDAFRRQAGVHHTVPRTDAGQLLAYVTELRYLRSDVHASCLADEGLSGPNARVLHRLWRGADAAGGPDPTLISSDLVAIGADSRLRLTPRGEETFERVEAATNERFAAVFGPLEDRHSTELLAGMRTLAGDDPRPPEDR